MTKTRYRVLSARLRVKRTDGRPRLDVARPVDSNGRYTDSDQEPTLIELDEHCRVDVAFLLRVGAIAPLVEEAPLPSVLPAIMPPPVVPEVKVRHG